MAAAHSNTHHFIYLYNDNNDVFFTKDVNDLKTYSNKDYKYCLIDNSEWYNNWQQYSTDQKKHFKTFDLTMISGAKMTWKGMKQLPNYFWSIPYISGYYLRDLIFPVQPEYPTKLFTSLNFRKKQHRDYLIDYLAKYDLIENNYISYKQFSVKKNLDYKFKFFDGGELVLQEAYLKDFESAANAPEFKDIPEHAYKDSLFSLVTESSTKALWMTEKTTIPMYHKRPFIILAAPGYYAYLKSLGFHVFDDVVDTSFDLEQDVEKRTEMIVKEIVRLNKISLKKLYKRTRHSVLHNFHQIKRKVHFGEPSLKHVPFVLWHHKYNVQDKTKIARIFK